MAIFKKIRSTRYDTALSLSIKGSCNLRLCRELCRSKLPRAGKVLDTAGRASKALPKKGYLGKKEQDPSGTTSNF